MSDEYRPWDLGKTPKPQPMADAADPAAPNPPKALDPPPTDAFQKPPGLHEATPQVLTKTPDVAGGMLLANGGLFLLAGTLAFVLFSMFRTAFLAAGDAYSVEDAEVMGTLRTAIGLPLLAMGAGCTAAGFGVLYGQRWSRGLGIGMSIVTLITLVGTIPSIIALATIGRPFR